MVGVEALDSSSHRRSIGKRPVPPAVFLPLFFLRGARCTVTFYVIPSRPAVGQLCRCATRGNVRTPNRAERSPETRRKEEWNEMPRETKNLHQNSVPSILPCPSPFRRASIREPSSLLPSLTSQLAAVSRLFASTLCSKERILSFLFVSVTSRRTRCGCDRSMTDL